MTHISEICKLTTLLCRPQTIETKSHSQSKTQLSLLVTHRDYVLLASLHDNPNSYGPLSGNCICLSLTPASLPAFPPCLAPALVSDPAHQNCPCMTCTLEDGSHHDCKHITKVYRLLTPNAVWLQAASRVKSNSSRLQKGWQSSWQASPLMRGASNLCRQLHLPFRLTQASTRQKMAPQA